MSIICECGRDRNKGGECLETKRKKKTLFLRKDVVMMREAAFTP